MNHLPLRIAWRYMLSKKSHTAVSIISAITVCAVAVTSMAMVCVLSVFNGFSGIVNGKLSKFDPQIKIIAAAGKTIADADSVVTVVRSVEGVVMAEPSITDNALAVYGEKQVPVMLKGVTDGFAKMSDIESLVKEDGEYILSYGGQYFSVVSVGTAVALGAHPGYTVPFDLYAPKRLGIVNPANPSTAFRAERTYLSGVFEVEQTEYDTNYVIVSIDLARKLLNYGRAATAIEVKLADGVSDEAIYELLQRKLGDGYKVQTRLMQHDNSLKMINIEKWVTFLLLGFILVIASFNIISTLSILILEKNQSISSLRAMGADNKMISRIFVTEGWLISMTGAVSGVVLGVVLCLLQQHFGFVKMSTNAKELIIDSYPVAVELSDMLSVLAAVAVVGFFTSWATAVAMRRRLRS